MGVYWFYIRNSHIEMLTFWHLILEYTRLLLDQYCDWRGQLIVISANSRDETHLYWIYHVKLWATWRYQFCSWSLTFIDSRQSGLVWSVNSVLEFECAVVRKMDTKFNLIDLFIGMCDMRGEKRVWLCWERLCTIWDDLFPKVGVTFKFSHNINQFVGRQCLVESLIGLVEYLVECLYLAATAHQWWNNPSHIHAHAHSIMELPQFIGKKRWIYHHFTPPLWCFPPKWTWPRL